VLADLRSQFQHVGQGYSVLERPLAGALDHRAVRDGIAERHPELNHVGTGVNRR
jgi:hypothetical protein